MHASPFVHVFPSSQLVPSGSAAPPVHTPASHVSAVVHTLPSLHAVPSGLAGFEHVPVAGSQLPTSWHCSAAVQPTGLLPVHLPASQVSALVQALPSLQAVPLGAAGFEHWPVAGSHVPASWHWSEAVQVTGLLPTQLPPSQVSLCVQALLSLQAVPLAAAGFEHSPVAGSHVPASWHWSEGVQTTGLAPVHPSARQVSVCVHASPSVHGVSSVAVIPMQRPARQASPVVHSLPSLQAVPSGAGVPWHTPRVQVPWTHPSPSSQGVPSSTAPPRQRPSRHCASVVQGLPSSQGVPSVTIAPVQVPLTHCSSVVQGLPSSQGVPSSSWALPVHSPAWQVSTVVHPLPSSAGVSLALFGFEHCPEVGSQV